MAIKKVDKFLNNNESLPVNITIDYTPDQVLEMQKCMDDVIYFAENYFVIVHLDKGRQKIKLFDAQKRAITSIIDNKRTIICASRQIGKALALDTPIPTPDGWKTMGELKDGDSVFDENGKSCTVIKAHDVRVDRNCFEITFSNGEKIIADESHEWFTQTRNERKREIIGTKKTTLDIFNTLTVGQTIKEPKHRIFFNSSVEYGTKEQTIDPYLLGYWLGDGFSAGSRIIVGKQDIENVLTNFEFISNKTITFIPKKNAFHINILKDQNNISFKSKLEKLNLLNNKHIPNNYIQGDRSQRLEILKGLMDSDGYCNSKGVCQFYTIKLQLAENVKELLYSLGIQCSLTSKIPTIKGKPCNEVFMVTFSTDEIVFKLDRKAKRQKQNIDKKTNRNRFIYIKDVKKVDSVPVRCISVNSKSNLFLCGKTFIPTSNSTLMTIVCLWHVIFKKDYQVAILANKEDQAKEILERIKLAYEELPNWLKTGVSEFTKEVLKLVNGSKIFVSTTSESGIRGKSVNMLFVDEFAHIASQIAEPFFKSVMPTISSSKSAKIVLISCVTKDTHVITEDGICQIEEFIDEDKEKGYYISPYKVLGKNKTRTGNIMFNSGESEIYQIISQSSQLKGSPEHKLLSCKNRKYGWHKMSELSAGDFIAIQYGNEIWGKDDKIDFVPSISNKLKNIFYPKEITPELAYLMGLYISEGSCYKKYVNGKFIGGSVTLTCGDNLHNAIINANLTYTKTENDDLHYNISSKNFIEFLEYIGFDLSKKAPEKVIPKRLLKMSRENIIQLLRGIFDGDGSAICDGRVNISSSSKILIEQIKILLLNFGIMCEYSEGITPPTKKAKVSSKFFRIIMNGINAQNYYKKIGFNFSRKQEILEKHYKNKKLIINNMDNIPFVQSMLKNDFRKVKKKYLSKGFVNSFYENAPISRHRLLQFKKTYGFTNNLLNEIVDDNIRWEKIKSNNIIGKENVYDFSLPNQNETDPYDWNHSVIYNGIIGHQTPKGAEGKFYEIFRDAEKASTNGKKSGWTAVRIHYSEVPGRDEEWKKEELASINYDMDTWRQEYEIEFLENGTSALNQGVIERMKGECYPAEFSFDEGEYLIWKEPEANRIISIGVDVAEGVGQDYTIAIVMDITDLDNIELCAIFASNKMQPWIFAEKLNQIARSWGRPFLCIERNKEGGQVIDAMMNVHNYDNIVHYSMKNDKRNVYQNPGIFCHQNSKYTGIQNMKYFVENKQSVKIYDINTIREFETFVRKINRTWGAKKGFNDDRVMALVWALVLLEKDIAEKYLDIIEYDEAGKPSVISDPNQHLANAGMVSLLNESRPIRDIGAAKEYNVFFNYNHQEKINIPQKYQDMLENSTWEFV